MDMLFDGLEAFLADDMFNAAGVIIGDILWDAEGFQNFGDHFVTFIDHLGNGPSFIGQINITGVGHGDLLFLPQILHGDAHAGLLEIQFVGHIHGTNYRESFTQN